MQWLICLLRPFDILLSVHWMLSAWAHYIVNKIWNGKDTTMHWTYPWEKCLLYSMNPYSFERKKLHILCNEIWWIFPSFIDCIMIRIFGDLDRMLSVWNIQPIWWIQFHFVLYFVPFQPKRNISNSTILQHDVCIHYIMSKWSLTILQVSIFTYIFLASWTATIEDRFIDRNFSYVQWAWRLCTNCHLTEMMLLQTL